MSVATLGLCALLGSSLASTQLFIDPPETTDRGVLFRIEHRGPAPSINEHVDGRRLILFFPKAKANRPQTGRLRQGPLEGFAVKTVKTGVVMTLRTRDPAKALLPTLRYQPQRGRLMVGTYEPSAAQRPNIETARPTVSKDTRASPDKASLGLRSEASGWSGSAYAAMAGLALLALAATAMLKKRGMALPSGHKDLQVVAVKSLGVKHKIALVRAGNKELLVASGENGVHLLGNMSETPPASNPSDTAQPHDDALSDDLQGLMRLKTPPPANGFFSLFQNKDGVA